MNKIFIFIFFVNFNLVLAEETLKSENLLQSDKILSLINVKDMSDGSLNSEFLLALKNIFNTQVFLETGTYLGRTTARAADFFAIVESIELSPDLYASAKENLKDKKNIILYQGDSAAVLPQILVQLKDKRILFWLDGHYSGFSTAKGNSATPVLEELKAIKSSGITNSVILIDDIRLFDKCGTVPEHAVLGCYPTLEDLIVLIYQINKNYKIIIYGDILFAFIDRNIQVSQFVESCTASRLFNTNQYDVNKVLQAERFIGNSNSSEFLAIKTLQSWLNGKYFTLWYAINLFYKKDYKQAYVLFKKVNETGLNDNRIKWYLNECKSKEML